MNAKKSIYPIAILALGIVCFLFSFPAPKNVFGQATTTSSTSGVSITIGAGISGGTGGGNNNDPAIVTFSGYASPNMTLTFRQSGNVIGTTNIGSGGLFNETANAAPGYTTFNIRGRDILGLLATTDDIVLNVSPGSQVTIANIFISPTITADRFNLQKGGTLRIYGSAFPGSTVRIFNNFISSGNPIGQVETNNEGIWEYYFPTSSLNDGQYSIKVNAQIDSPHLVSPFSENLEFTIAEITCSGADFNFDTRVNIVDFSILIFYWERNPAIGNITNVCTDLNTDEIVNIFDFSILMHEWTE